MKLCKCGCGQPTIIISKTNKKLGRIKSKYNNYIHGHWSRANKEFLGKIASRTFKKLGNPMHRISAEKKEEWKKKISISTQGRIPWDKGIKRPEISREKHPRWRGGIVKIGKYVSILLPNGCRIKEHHLVMYKIMGRKLKPFEVIHHIDHNPANNSIKNLTIMNSKEHAKLHALGVI